MVNKKMWDWMDKAEGRKDSSYANMMKEREHQEALKAVKPGGQFQKPFVKRDENNNRIYGDSRRRSKPKSKLLFGFKPIRFR